MARVQGLARSEVGLRWRRPLEAPPAPTPSGRRRGRGSGRRRRPLEAPPAPTPRHECRESQTSCQSCRDKEAAPAPVGCPPRAVMHPSDRGCPNAWRIGGARVAPGGFLGRPSGQPPFGRPPIAACLLGSGGDAIASFKIVIQSASRSPNASPLWRCCAPCRPASDCTNHSACTRGVWRPFFFRRADSRTGCGGHHGRELGP